MVIFVLREYKYARTGEWKLRLTNHNALFFVIFCYFFFLLCARLIRKMNGNAHLYARKNNYVHTKYMHTGEWKLRFTSLILTHHFNVLFC